MEDRRIVTMLLERDHDAIRAVQEKYGKRLKRLAQRIVYDIRDAEECVNDALMQMWLTIPPHEPESLGAFLSVIVRQKAVDCWRRMTAEKRGGTEYELSLDELAECVSGVEAVSAAAVTEAINQYLRTLSPTMRIAFVRRYFAAESISEIARALHCSENKVKSILFRTRKGLRNFLEQEGFDL